MQHAKQSHVFSQQHRKHFLIGLQHSHTQQNKPVTMINPNPNITPNEILRPVTSTPSSSSESSTIVSISKSGIGSKGANNIK